MLREKPWSCSKYPLKIDLAKKQLFQHIIPYKPFSTQDLKPFSYLLGWAQCAVSNLDTIPALVCDHVVAKNRYQRDTLDTPDSILETGPQRSLYAEE